MSSVSVLQPICELDEDFAELLLDFALLLDQIIPLELQDDSEESSSFEEVLLSSPQATRAIDRKKASRDCIAMIAMTLFIPNFLIRTPLIRIKYKNLDVNRLTIEKNYI